MERTSTGDRPALSVLIATRDRPHALARCIDSVLDQRLDDLEVRVFDDASTDGPIEKSLETPVTDPRVSFHRSDDPVGVVGARNTLMREARAPIQCHLDDDAYFEDPGALAYGLRRMEEDPSIGLLTGKIVDHVDDATRLLLPIPKRARRRDPGIEDRTQDVSSFLGALHFLRREAVERTGGYHPELFWGGEELDLSYRLVKAGFRMVYEPDLVVHHEQLPTVLGEPGDREGKELERSVRNRLYLAYRHLPARFLPSYLTVWLGWLAYNGLRDGTPGAFLTGLRDAIREMDAWKRDPLGDEAVEYLFENHGRLWY